MLCIIQMKMGGKVSRNAPDNEKLSSPSFIMSPWLVKKTCIQGYPGCKQCCFRRDSEKGPTPIPSTQREGGGDQHLLCGPEGIENIFRKLR